MIIYLHIAKTGGTTMLHYLERQCTTYHLKSWWRPDYWDVPRDTECIFSHCPYGEIDKRFPGEYQYATFLRDPVDRLVSNYYHVTTRSIHPNFTEYSKYPLDELVLRGEFSTLDNGMVRLLSGRHDIGNLPSLGKVTSDDLERAKENLSTFTAVGFLDTFDEDLVRFAKIFGWTDLRYNWYRKGKGPPMDESILEVVREANQYDQELVDFARRHNETHTST